MDSIEDRSINIIRNIHSQPYGQV